MIDGKFCLLFDENYRSIFLKKQAELTIDHLLSLDSENVIFLSTMSYKPTPLENKLYSILKESFIFSIFVCVRIEMYGFCTCSNLLFYVSLSVSQL